MTPHPRSALAIVLAVLVTVPLLVPSAGQAAAEPKVATGEARAVTKQALAAPLTQAAAAARSCASARSWSCAAR
jgi:hypothetical protein